MSEHDYSSSKAPLLIAGLVTAAIVIVGFLVLRSQQPSSPGGSEKVDGLVIYCAAGIRKPVEQLAAAYQEQFGVTVRLNYGSSGEMEGKLQLDAEQNISRADLYIPADESFSERTRDKGLTVESIPLARFNLVLAGKPGGDLGITKLQDVLDKKLRWTLCEPHAGVGRKTKTVLGNLGLYDTFYQGAKTSFPRVPEAAGAIAAGDIIDCGFIWDSTARQFGLKTYELPELAAGEATISVNVVSSTKNPTAALKLARWLAAKEHAPVFEEHFFTALEVADSWVEHPDIELYSGGLNREAVADTLRAFEQREGCTIKVQYAGCGTLVAGIDARETAPDGFLTCDASYLEKVSDRYGDDTRVSRTRILMLVREGNPKGLHTIADLAKPDIKIGTNDPTKSTLGFLSWELFRVYGVDDDIKKNGTLAVFTPTAHELIAQMEASDKLDVGLVYEANVQHLSGPFELIPIDHPRATAIQNVAVAKASQHPRLVERLIAAIVSPESRQRYEELGFSWEAE